MDNKEHYRLCFSSGTLVKYYISLNKEEVLTGMLKYQDWLSQNEHWSYNKHTNIWIPWMSERGDFTIFRPTSHLLATASWYIICTGLIHDLSATNSWVCSSLPFKFTATQDILTSQQHRPPLCQTDWCRFHRPESSAALPSVEKTRGKEQKGGPRRVESLMGGLSNYSSVSTNKKKKCYTQIINKFFFKRWLSLGLSSAS